MTRTHLAAGGIGLPGETVAAGGDVQTVVVGVKLDEQSRELLTWCLLKVARPSDRVIALHVVGNDESVDPDGKSSLMSIVGAFDSVLAAYEGFCNLKQVDLKFKVCHGSSVETILVREAQSCTASKLILGTSSKYHRIRSSASLAKYCAKKLSKECSVLAVHCGKIVFHKEISTRVAKTKSSQGTTKYQKNTLLSILNRSTNDGLNPNVDSDGKGGTNEDLEKILTRASSDCSNTTLEKKCGICSPDINGHSENCHTKKEEDKSEVISRPVRSLLWQALSSESGDSDPSSSSLISTTDSTTAKDNFDDEDAYFDLDGENNDMVQDQNATGLPLELETIHERYSSSCRLFLYQELQLATSNFAPENLIGNGGSSRVYQGRLPDGKKLAVKVLRQIEDVLKDFVFEIEMITSLHHKNIISLLGFCFEERNLLLVYDLLPRGSLEENLHGSKKDPVAFGWNERYMVAVGVAEALHYLHNCSGQPIIHRDVKSSNILLSDDFEPQLSDFGLAKRASTSTQTTFSDIAGTFGYLPPEYFMYGKVTDKIDVYAYGVVLLELLSGRKPITSNQSKGEESLVMWAKPKLSVGNVAPLLDSSLGQNYDADQMERMMVAANLCIRRSPRARPKMSLVLKLIQGDAETMKWARLQVSASDNPESLDPECYRCPSNIQSHLNLAFLDVEDDSLSVSSFEQNVSLEDYLKGRWSRSSSFA